MQAVILAAGRGTRMGELTKETPKSMLLVAGKPILAWILERLPKTIDEVIIVIGYGGADIQKAFGSNFLGKRIVYIEQKNTIGGTMDALLQARHLVHDTFIVLNGDGVYETKDIEECAKKPWAFGVVERDELGASSRVTLNDAGEIEEITEADIHGGGGGLAGVGPYALDERIFNVAPVRLIGRTEVGLPQTMLAAAKVERIPLHPVKVSSPLHFTSPADIAAAEMVLGKK